MSPKLGLGPVPQGIDPGQIHVLRRSDGVALAKLSVVGFTAEGVLGVGTPQSTLQQLAPAPAGDRS